jgi:hypothetical protein
MKPKFLLRLAAVVMLLHTIGHTFGALTWKHAPNNDIAGVIQAMEGNRFEFMGRHVTIAEFYQGYGIAMIFVLVLITVALWLSGEYVKDSMTQKLLPWMIGFLVCFSVTEAIYFFPLAAVMSLIAAILSLIAYVKGAKASQQQHSAS